MTPAPDSERGEFTVSSDPARLDFDLIHRYLSTEAYWARGIARDTLMRALAHSLCFGLYAGERQAGFARVITDTATYTYLDDVFALEPYRGRGLGGWLLDRILAHPDLQGLRRFSLATSDAQVFYASHGWHPLR